MEQFDLVGLMKEYGRMVEDLVNAKRDVLELQKQLEQTEAVIAKLEQEKLELLNKARLMDENMG